MSIFIDSTKRSANELLADLAACRALRHMKDEDRSAAIAETYLAMAKAWMGPKAIKHPDPNNLCEECGRPRSKFNQGNPGLCYRCYAVHGVEERDLWGEDVIEQAIHMFGFSCDACDAVSEPRGRESRPIADAMLNNLEGRVHPILCRSCSSDFKSYCSRHFGRGAWRDHQSRAVEKMSIGWFAQKVKVLAERVKRGSQTERRQDCGVTDDCRREFSGAVNQ